ncbi:hypothetical protein N825_09420 [Skermanella stibiiresistens SB22]|uniref:Uncharacterized protein n=1 Tax=Skermanella stibiiresistens SB22 TaxID=1385369 RepID=W9GV71_9PROT|nr:hypothetical protein [Skermanella stibiiresistens]EWY37790.1 hypothetical protein N825_09420 [Skermanella stibiiresistens SB22]
MPPTPPHSASRAFGRATPIGRSGQPVELAPVHVQSASVESSHITGEVYGASGGADQP